MFNEENVENICKKENTNNYTSLQDGVLISHVSSCYLLQTLIFLLFY
jgi:hypothetical protein